jgi:hypothetical protein
MRLAGATGGSYNTCRNDPQTRATKDVDMQNFRRLLWAGAVSLLVAPALVAASQKDSAEAGKRPKLTLKASPSVSMSPARVVLVAELVGGANDYQDYYCPTIEWDWGDDTQSDQTADCEPYQPGKSEIRRRFTVEHVFRAGNYRVSFRLKHGNQPLAVATTSIQVRPGIRDGGR